MRLDEYQGLVLEVVFANDPAPAIARLGGDARGWGIYRRGVRVRNEEVIERAMPRLRPALGDAPFEALLDAFHEARAIRSPYLRDVPAELLGFLESPGISRSILAGAPAWILDLARFEVAQFEVRNLGDEIGAEPAEVGDLSMDRPPVLAPAHRVVRVAASVHRPEAVVPGAFTLLVYRDDAQEVHVLELADTAAAIIEGASRGDRPLVEVVRDAASRVGVPIDGPFVDALTDLLADLVTRGVWLGSRPT